MTYQAPEPQPEGQSPQAPGTARLQPVTLRVEPVKPFVSYTLLGVTIFIFLLQMLSQYIFKDDIPVILMAKLNEQIRAGEFWRLLTPVFLHGSLIHIAFNMYALYVIGVGLERYYGHKRFLLLYFLAGFSGNLASFIFTPEPSLGASTAIFGLVAAQGVFVYKNKFLFGKNARSMLTNILSIILVNLALGLSPRIDNWGHLGGLVGGLFFSWFAGPRYQITGEPAQLFLDEKKTRPGYLMVALAEFFIISGLLAVFL